MEIIISNSSEKPIYEQISLQIKASILSGELTAGQMLPSIRSLAHELRVSVITTKRAYSDLEALGFIESVQGKGSFVTGENLELLKEERLRKIEEFLCKALDAAQVAQVSVGELHEMLDILSSQ